MFLGFEVVFWAHDVLATLTPACRSRRKSKISEIMADLKSCYLIETSELTLSFVNTDDPLPPIQEVIVGESNVLPKHPSDLILDPLDQGVRALDGCKFLESMDYLENIRDGSTLLGMSDSNVSPKPPKRKYKRSGKFSKEAAVKISP